MHVEDYIRSECDRQHTRNYGEMEEAYDWLWQRSAPSNDVSVSVLVQYVAYKCEPQVNQYHYGHGIYGNLRTSHVGFVGSPNGAAPTGEVYERFQRLMGLWQPDFTVVEVDQWIKSLLDIHPWADGNGRTASLVRNWMLGQLHDPEPLPYFYGNA